MTCRVASLLQIRYFTCSKSIFLYLLLKSSRKGSGQVPLNNWRWLKHWQVVHAPDSHILSKSRFYQQLAIHKGHLTTKDNFVQATLDRHASKWCPASLAVLGLLWYSPAFIQINLNKVIGELFWTKKFSFYFY